MYGVCNVGRYNKVVILYLERGTAKPTHYQYTRMYSYIFIFPFVSMYTIRKRKSYLYRIIYTYKAYGVMMHATTPV